MTQPTVSATPTSATGETQDPNPGLTRFRQRCFALAEALLAVWFALYGLAALSIMAAAVLFQAMSVSTLYVAGAATVLMILSGYIATPYLRGLRPEVAPRRIWLVLAMLFGIWGIEVAKDLSSTLYNATHARVEAVPAEVLAADAVPGAASATGPAVILYGAISRRTPKMLAKLGSDWRQQHPDSPGIRTIYLSSTGGDTKGVLETVKVAQSLGIEQTIAFGDCVSACATMWLLMPHPQLAEDSVLCFHGSHRTTSSKAVREVDEALRKAILDQVVGDAAAKARATAALDQLLSHGLWELTCPTPNKLVESGLLASVPATPVPFPEGVARYVTANPPACLAPNRMPRLPPAARDPKQDGCAI